LGAHGRENQGKRLTAANIAQQLNIEKYRKPLLDSMKRTLMAMGSAATIPQEQLKNEDTRREVRVYITRMRQGCTEIASSAEALCAELNARTDRLERVADEYDPVAEQTERAHVLAVDTRENARLPVMADLEL